ncbi:MAG: DUF1304 domain-containing protein [Myxococcota bacterium]|nr:DUF1304 domain-containing protein [Myxococcota bacterium]
MRLAAAIAAITVALQHLGFLVLEMFLWQTSVGMDVFGTTPEFARESAGLAANQGLYNGFLSAGLVFSLARGREGFATGVFFLACVVVAGVFGAATVSGRILWIQAAPAAVALVLWWLARPRD